MSPRLHVAAACALAAGAAITYIAVGSSSSQAPSASAATPTTTPAAPPMVRTYYVAADAVDWNYAPLGYNAISGQAFGDQENVFVKNGPDRIGSTYRKSIYREYTDASFRTLKPRLTTPTSASSAP